MNTLEIYDHKNEKFKMKINQTEIDCVKEYNIKKTIDEVELEIKISIDPETSSIDIKE